MEGQVVKPNINNIVLERCQDGILPIKHKLKQIKIVIFHQEGEIIVLKLVVLSKFFKFRKYKISD